MRHGSMVCTVTVYMPSGKGNFNLENIQVSPPPAFLRKSISLRLLMPSALKLPFRISKVLKVLTKTAMWIPYQKIHTRNTVCHSKPILFILYLLSEISPGSFSCMRMKGRNRASWRSDRILSFSKAETMCIKSSNKGFIECLEDSWFSQRGSWLGILGLVQCPWVEDGNDWTVTL